MSIQNGNINVRVFKVFGTKMSQFYKFISLPYVPSEKTFLNIDGKTFNVHSVVINYDDETKGSMIDLYIKESKDSAVLDLINNEKILPTHLASPDFFRKDRG